MLASLSIRDVVLIDRLDLSFQAGLCVLTGETGAGKSILLDSLGLALGMRAEARLVRAGKNKAVVTASFDLPLTHPASLLMEENGFDPTEGMVLKRILSADGRSRAFVNDQPASVGFLKKLGETLVEIHGQFETQGLLNASAHRSLLDAYGSTGPLFNIVSKSYREWQHTLSTRKAAESALVKAQEEEDYLRHVVAELNQLACRPGEEEELAKQRSMMMHGEKLIEATSSAASELTRNHGVEANLRSAIRHLERIADKADGKFEEVIEALDRAAVETGEAMALLNRAIQEIDLNPRHLEEVEERLFALKAAARKHNITVEALPNFQKEIEQQLAAIENGGTNLKELRQKEDLAKADYVEAAEKLSISRQQAASRLDVAVSGELPPMKLDRATFKTTLTKTDENGWNETGWDQIAFQVSTNPGSPLGPISKIASGGELARFMLALKVILAESDPVPTLVFDEVDAGTGGAVAASVGERLSRLGQDVQVLVVTHSPQVAALGAHHWRISKAETPGGNGVVTSVHALEDGERLEEVARMLAGANVTDQARAAAQSLMEGSQR
ncbi:MAG: DNA repair protein RecN [Rhodospirillales bacterium]|nr:DNA repair protein RecN [Rhodospirillales bacterium]